VDAGRTGHVIVCGLQGLGVRVIELLASAGVPTVVVDHTADDRSVRIAEHLGIHRMYDSPRRPEALWAAGLAGASAVVCVEDDDLRCLETALLIRELRADVQIVLRQSNPAVGRAVSSATLPGAVLDPAALAANTFVDAVLGRRNHSFDVAGLPFRVHEAVAGIDGTLRDQFGDITPIAVVHDDGVVAVCPDRDYQVAAGDRVSLVGPTSDLSERFDDRSVNSDRDVHRPGLWSQWTAATRSLMYGADRGLRWIAAGMFALGAFFVIVLLIGYRDTPARELDPLDAIFFATETLTTIGYGTFTVDEQPVYLRLVAIGVMIVGAILLAIFYALVTEALVTRRIAATFGLQQVTRMRDHVIVVGLGSLGVAVLEVLRELGQRVVVVERDSANRHIGEARALGAPVITADGTQSQTLISANLDYARAVAVLTSDEYANIETGLAVQDKLGPRAPSVPVVMRVFERRLGRTLESRFGFHQVRSVSALSAPWFVAAALGLEVIDTFSVDQVALMAGRLRVRADGGLVGAAMADLPIQARVVAIKRDGELTHSVSSRTELLAGDEAFIVGPPEHLMSLMMRNRET